MTEHGSPLTRRALALGAGATAAGVALPRRWFRSPPRRGVSIPAGAWRMDRRDPARTGHAPEQTVPTAKPAVRWTVTLPADRRTWSRLVGTPDTVCAATDRAVYAFDAATGERRWRTTRIGTLPWTDEATWVETGPALGDRRLFVGALGDLSALGQDDGRAAWQYETNSSLSASLLAGNTVYVSSSVGSGNRLVALDARSGIERWRTPPDIGVHPTAYADGYLVGSTIERYGAFGAVGVSAGETAWTRDIQLDGDSGLPSAACIADGTVYVGTGPLYALALADGATRWSASLGTAGEEAVPVTDGSRVYLALGEAGSVVALDAETGDEDWRVAVPDAADGSAPAIAGGTLYVGTERGVVALDAATGEKLWQVRESESANRTNSPVVAGGTLYVALGRTLYALGGKP